MRYYSFFTAFRSLKNILTDYLKSNGFYYEIAGGPAAWYFSILTDTAGADKINAFIYENSITEKGAEI